MSFMKRLIGLLVLALFLAGLAGFFFWARTPLAIDRCLDQGGRWDYLLDVCESRRRGSYFATVETFPKIAELL